MRVLVVEDEPRLSRALCELLREQKYMVDAVTNGADGLAFAESGIYDCIILDVMLPQKDGFTVTRELREKKIATPILLLTAKAAVRDKVTGLDCGADDYMTKPFSPEELLARIRTLTRRRGEVVLDEIAFEDIIFSLFDFVLTGTSTGRSIRLSHKESELLKIFLAQPRRIIPKEELLIKVWGFDTTATDNNVEAYVSFLRKKLLYVGSECQIIVTKKLGYRLEAPPC